MRSQKYAIKLTIEERKELMKIKCCKSSKGHTKKHAKILMCLDENGENALTVEQTAVKCKLHPENIYKIRKQFVEEGMERALYRKKRETPPVAPKVTGEIEAHIIATACSAVPKGKKAWTMQMIADKITLDTTLDSISDETVRRVLKKRNISLI